MVAVADARKGRARGIAWIGGAGADLEQSAGDLGPVERQVVGTGRARDQALVEMRCGGFDAVGKEEQNSEQRAAGDGDLLGILAEATGCEKEVLAIARSNISRTRVRAARLEESIPGAFARLRMRREMVRSSPAAMSKSSRSCTWS